MESNHRFYNYETSFDRIDDIIAQSDNSFEELSSIPSRDKLTFSNGFYVNCTALFVDIRGSSNLPDDHHRPKLAKLYRVYISEVVAVINANSACAEINIVGDSVSGIFNTYDKSQIDAVFSTAYTIASLIDVINYKFKKYKIREIEIGIGLSYGRALMIKAGYKGSGLNEIVWMGNVVNEASNLCGKANKNGNREIMASPDFHCNLNELNQSLLTYNYGYYHGYVVNKAMEEWLNNEQAKSSNY